jgi:acyl-CoA reductase-like NAD-dependent aldehyde dehydrogenase
MKKRAVRLAFDNTVIGEVEELSPGDLGPVLDRAQLGAATMAAWTRWERAELLRHAAAKFFTRKEELAHTIALEASKPITEARAEVDRARCTLLFSAEEASRLAGEEIPMDAAPTGRGRMALTIRQPVGVIAAITPFNFPLNLSMHKVGPAIAAGCAVVHKPASTTPLSALLARDILLSCGLPPEALQVVVGPGAVIGAALADSPIVKMITFTGSAAVGFDLKARAGRKRVTLELGNNSAVLVLRDADIDAAADACVAGAFANSGQTCISVQRVYADAAIHDAFLERIVTKTNGLRAGHPLDESTQIASLINAEEASRVQQWLSHTVAMGAQRLTGGSVDGARLSPTVIRGLPQGSPLQQEELFGPALGIERISSPEEGIAKVNNSRFGLQAGVFTNDLKLAWRCAREIECGGVLINDVSNYRVDQMPYGGWKESGTGKEGPRWAVEEMTELKLVSWRT